MPYSPLHPDLPNKSIFNNDHLAYIENGILGNLTEAKGYVDAVAVQIQAGQVTDAAFDAAVDRAAADGRLVVEGGGGTAPGVEVVETQPGAYQFTSGDTAATVYGLTSSQILPATAKSDLRNEFPTKTEAAATFAPALVGGKGPVRRDELTVNVRDYGANGDDITDDTAAIQAAVDAVVAAGGGSVFFPRGRYLISAPIVITGRSVRLYGVSPMASIIETAASIDMIVFDGGESALGDGCVVESLRVHCTGAPTAGAAVFLKSGFGHRLTHVRLGHYDCVRVENAYGFVIDGGSYLLTRGRHGVYNRSILHPDRGDSTIMGSVFNDATGNSESAICLESGGGIKVFGNKILQHKYGVLLQPEEFTTTLVAPASSGATSVTLTNGTGLSTNGQLYIGTTRYTVSTFNRDTGVANLASGLVASAAAGATVLVGIATSVFPITGNSMEGQKVAHVKAKRKGTVGQLSYFTFTGGQFNGSAANGTITDGFLIGAGADHGSIVGATMYGKAGAAAFHFEDGASNWNVDSNNLSMFLNGTQIDNGAVDIQVGEGNKYGNGVTYPLVNSSSSGAVSPVKQSRWSRATPYLTSTVNYATLFRVECNPARAADMRLVVEGSAQPGVGAFFRRLDFVLTRPVNAASAVSVAVSNDVSAGVPITITLDTSTAGAVLVRMRRDPADGSSGLGGTATLIVDGNLSRIQIP